MQALFANFFTGGLALGSPQTPKMDCSYAANWPRLGRQPRRNAMLRNYSRTADRVPPTRLQRIADPPRKDTPDTRPLSRGAP